MFIRSANATNFYEYDPSNDSWTQKAPVGGGINNYAAQLSALNGKGDTGTGYDGTIMKQDFWTQPGNNTLYKGQILVEEATMGKGHI